MLRLRSYKFLLAVVFGVLTVSFARAADKDIASIGYVNRMVPGVVVSSAIGELAKDGLMLSTDKEKLDNLAPEKIYFPRTVSNISETVHEVATDSDFPNPISVGTKLAGVGNNGLIKIGDNLIVNGGAAVPIMASGARTGLDLVGSVLLIYNGNNWQVIGNVPPVINQTDIDGSSIVRSSLSGAFLRSITKGIPSSTNRLITESELPNEFELMPATNTLLGGVMLYQARGGTPVVPMAATANANRSYPLQLDSDGKAYVNVPWVQEHITAVNGGSGVVKTLSYSNNTITAARSKIVANELSPTIGTAGQVLKLDSGLNLVWGNADIGMATSSESGLMSAADKIKLDNLEQFSLNPATATVLGGVKLGSATAQTVAANAVSATTGKTYSVQNNASGQLVVNVPWTDNNTTYGAMDSTILTAGTDTAQRTITAKLLSDTFAKKSEIITDTDTGTNIIAGGTASVANATSTNGNTFVNAVHKGAKVGGVNIVGTGGATVVSDAAGKITINAPATSSANTALVQADITNSTTTSRGITGAFLRGITAGIPSATNKIITADQLAAPGVTGLMTGDMATKLAGLQQYTHPAAGVNTGSFGPTANTTLTSGGTFIVPQITVNSDGHATGVVARTLTLPTIPAAPTSLALTKSADTGTTGDALKVLTASSTATNAMKTKTLKAGSNITITADATDGITISGANSLSALNITGTGSVVKTLNNSGVGTLGYITSADITDGTIATADIADRAITSAKITPGAGAPVVATFSAGNVAAVTGTAANFVLTPGAMVVGRWNTGANVANTTLNVNGTGAIAVRYNNAAIGASRIPNNAWAMFVYDGTVWNVIDTSDDNTTYNQTIREGVTANGNAAAVTATSAGFPLSAGVLIKIKWAGGTNVANATLDVNSTGAKNIYVNNARVAAGAFANNDIILFRYDGTNYYATKIITDNGAPTYGVLTLQRNGATLGTFTANSNATVNMPLANGTTSGLTVYKTAKTGTAAPTPVSSGTYFTAEQSSDNVAITRIPLATSSESGLMSAAHVSKLNGLEPYTLPAGISNVPTGICDTGTQTGVAYTCTSAHLTGQTLKYGDMVTVRFDGTSIAGNLTLNVSGTGAKAIRYGSATTGHPAGYIRGGVVLHTFYYDGAYWVPMGPLGTNFVGGVQIADLSITNADIANNTITAAKLTGGTAGYILQSNGTSAPTWVAKPASGLMTITSNSSTTGTSATVPIGMTLSGTTATLTIADATASIRGVVNTGAQTIAGVKTFNAIPIIPTAPLP